MSTVRIECVSLVTTDSKATNLKNYVKYIEDAAANGVNILVLPEYSSTGLPDDISMNYVSKAEKKHFEENAELIPQGETVQLMMEPGGTRRDLPQSTSRRDRENDVPGGGQGVRRLRHGLRQSRPHHLL